MSRVRANTIMDQAGSGGPDFPLDLLLIVVR